MFSIRASLTDGLTQQPGLCILSVRLYVCEVMHGLDQAQTGIVGYIILIVSRTPALSYFAVFLAAA
jgi:hypothetical protein